jgi:threonine/homoserine/homoserine lactone efflux protein
MRLEPILAYVVFSVVTSVTPGPNNVMLTATGANVGIRRGMPHLLGISFGFGAMLFLLTAGMATALTENATLMLVLKIGGIVVLLWLAWKVATSGRAKSIEGKRPIGFLGAVAFQWINPKAWLIAAGSVSFLQPRYRADPAGGVLRTDVRDSWHSLHARLARSSARRCSGCCAPSCRPHLYANVAMGLLLAATVPLLL